MPPTIEKTMFSGLGIAFVVLMLILVAFYYNTLRLIETIRWEAHTHKVLTELERTISLLKDVESRQRGYVIAGEERFLERFDAAVGRMHDQVVRVRQLTADNPSQQRALDTLEPLITKRLDTAQEAISLRQEGLGPAQQSVLLGQGRQEMEAIRQVVTSMQQEEHALLQQREAATYAQIRITVLLLVVGTVAQFALLAAIYVLVKRDIAGRRRTEAALRDSEERLRLIVNHANDALFFLNTAGVIWWTNPQAEKVTGRPMNGLMGQPFQAVLGSQSKAVAEGRLAAVRRGENVPALVELEVIRPDGKAMWVEVSSTSVKRDGEVVEFDPGAIESAGPRSTSVKKDQEVIGWLLVVRDIAERKAMEQQLRQADKLAALGTLLGGVAHELNNPLFAVSGYTHLICEKVKQGRYEGLAGDLAALSEGAQRASAVVERFLGVARATQGRREPCAVNALVQRILALMANEFNIQQIEVRTAFQSDLPLIRADSQELSQVFLNLFTNAGQAMSKAHGRGTLTVTTALVAIQAKPFIEVRVADDGPGIDPENLTRIFDPFFTTKPVGQGTGLGLAICHRIVTELEGTLTCEVVVGHGATFIMRLPAVPTEGADR